MKFQLLVLATLFALPAFASNQFASYNGSYTVVGQDCVYPVEPDGSCSATIYATEVNISGDAHSGLINVINPMGGYTKIEFTDEGTQNLPGVVATTNWITSDVQITNHVVDYYPFDQSYGSSSVSLGSTAKGLKLTFASSHGTQTAKPRQETPEFIMYLQAK